MKGLSKRQLEVLGFIEDSIKTHRFSPSYREIMRHFGLKSVSTVAKLVNTLKHKGALTLEPRSPRSLFVPPKQSPGNEEIQLPYIGYISGNGSLELFPQSQTLAVPQFLVNNPDSTYVFRARGNSLMEELILDGDLLLIETRTEPEEEETVVARLEPDRTIIRKYQSKGQSIRLVSQSPDVPALIVDHEDLEVQGILISLLRFYT